MKSNGFMAAPPRRQPAPKAAGRLGLLALLLALLTPALFYIASHAQVRRPANVKSKQQAPAPARTAEPDEVETKKARPVVPVTKAKPEAPAQTKPRAPVLTKPEAPVLTEAPAPRRITSARIQPVSVTRVSFKQVAELSKRARLATPLTTPTLRSAPVPGSIRDTPAGAPLAAGDVNKAAGLDDTGGPLVPSPSPSQSFLAQEDGPKAGTSSFLTPPDTNGAVGLDRVFTNTNTNYRIHDKTTGAPLSTVSTDTFWAASGGVGFFDPQIQFDPYNQRWILAIVSNGSAASSSISVAVSQTSDPSGSYHVFRFVVGCAGGTQDCDPQGEWADFPMLGFNKNWIAVTVNMFEVNGTGPGGGQQTTGFRALVLDYPSARAGSAATHTIVRGHDPFHAGFFFCVHPVTTYSATEETLYLPQHLSSGAAWYSLSGITGTPAAPTFNLGETRTRPGGGWTQPGGDILPQQCVAGPGAPTPSHLCPTFPRKIDAGDSFIRSNPVYRNGRVYYAQTVGLPADGMTRTAAQWTVLDAATGNFVDGGRVDDPAATDSNGGRWYAYPSLSVNKNGDILLGFSEFESDDYADAGYAFRLATDPAGTTRDPVVYKEGEDYYEKTFSTTRNRWGDYSHTLVDPANDRDMWTVQEYAQARVGTTGTGINDSRWGTWWAKVAAPAAAGDLIISEFRLFGPDGPAGTPAPEPNEDEFVEIYNTNDSAFTVTTVDGSAGYSVAASDGALRCTIPAGTVIPGRGHFLCANSDGYSLSGHAAGTPATATPDATYTLNIPNNAGIALFNTANTSNYSTATRLDAVGSAVEANALYREGVGYPPLNQALINYAFYRDACGNGGATTVLGACPTGGFPRDTNENGLDFLFVDTSGTNAGAWWRLGAPGPENLSSPVQRNSQVAGTLLDPSVGTSSAPNRVRSLTSEPANNSTFGTLLLRRTFTNNTGAPVTRLRFRVVDVTTYRPSPGNADLRARTSSPTPSVPTVVTITGTNTACPSRQCAVQQTTLETPPAQANGGGFNSTLGVGSVTVATPIPPGGQVNVQFMLGIQQTGTFKFFVNIETLP